MTQQTPTAPQLVRGSQDTLETLVGRKFGMHDDLGNGGRMGGRIGSKVGRIHDYVRCPSLSLTSNDGGALQHVSRLRRIAPPIADADPIGLDDPISGRDSRPAALVRRPFSNPRPEPMTATQDRNSRPLHCNMVFILGRLIHFSNLSLL